MSQIATSIRDLIGETPLYQPLRWLEDAGSPDAPVYLKLESFNATGSVKDRPALGMLRDLEARGILKPGGTIIEPTSGNTGIALAALGAAAGYRVILTMPDTMSKERRQFLSAYGAEIVLTPGADSMQGAVDRARELRDTIDGAVIPSQFDNPANPASHEATTGPEIEAQSGGDVDVLLAGIGTGGTLTGTARYLRTRHPELEVIAVEPAESPVITEGRSGAHGIQGIGANFVPENYDAELVTRVLPVTTEAAKDETRRFTRCEGLLTGFSAGAALAAVRELLKDPDYRTKRIVAILPDSGDRYLSEQDDEHDAS